MFSIVLRKMLNNKWMTLCIIIGSIITVAMFSSIPIYTDGIIQRMLTKDLEQAQETQGIFPGGYLIEYDNSYLQSEPKDKNLLNYLDQKISQVVSGSINLPILARCRYINAGSFAADSNSTDQESGIIDIVALSNLREHIKITQGRIFSNLVSNSTYEVIASEEAVKVLDLVLGNTYELAKLGMTEADEKSGNFRVKIVGIFKYKTEHDPYWFKGIDQYNQSILMDQNLLETSFLINEQISIKTVFWYYAYDYHRVSLAKISTLLKTYAAHEKWFGQYFNISYKLPAISIIKKYAEREKKLRTILLVLEIPVLILLGFYSFMVAKLKIDFESNEIVVIKSRGGSGRLIFTIYLVESLLIGSIALLIGPFLGLLLCKLLGASNGFLEFVERTALPLSLKPQVYMYALMIISFISISMLIPAFNASRTSIVLYKQKKARERKNSFWERYFLDLVLLLISLYGLFSYQRQQKVLFISGIKGTDLTIDPLLFLISTAFLFGGGLLFLRIYPYIVRLVFRLGEKRWDPVSYASFIQVGRTSGQEQYVMLFIILTLAIGIFSANSARTLNKNIEEKVRYATGADIVVKGNWKSNRLPVSMGPSSSTPQELIYFEPPFDSYTNLDGVAAVTKALMIDNANVYIDNDFLQDISLLGIIPHEFGKTAWFRDDLLPYHWYQYLNLMTDSPQAVLVSKAFKDTLGLKEGDWLAVSWDKQQLLNVVIYAFIDYWPTLNPYKKTNGAPNPYFIVANLNYIQLVHSVEPYQVWLKKKPGATSNQIYRDMAKKKIELVYDADATAQIIKQKNDPMLQGTNGALTLNFIVTIIVSIIGFLIFWIMAIKKRVLQFGIFRAIGLTLPKIIKMLVWEQFLITGAAIVAGIFIGNITGRIFVPLLQMVYSAEEQVPPFRIISYPGDYLRLYVIFALMLIVAMFVLWRIITKINISQALKLGED